MALLSSQEKWRTRDLMGIKILSFNFTNTDTSKLFHSAFLLRKLVCQNFPFRNGYAISRFEIVLNILLSTKCLKE